MTQRGEQFDVVIVGGGPAGLNGALMLGRCRRSVLLCDDGQQRNLAAPAVRGLFTRDGTTPAALLEMGRKELEPYGVEQRQVRVTDVIREPHGFVVTCSDGQVVRARKVLLATGVTDELPDLDGIHALYGQSVHHCPYCDGWEVRDQPLAAWGRGRRGVGLALELLTWSRDVVLCLDGEALEAALAHRLALHGIRAEPRRIQKLDGANGILRRVVFEDGDWLARRALFFSAPLRQHANLVQRMGVPLNARGTAETGRYEKTDIPGLYVAGDASKDVQFVVVAAAEGAKAAFAINTELAVEDLHAVEQKKDAAG